MCLGSCVCVWSVRSLTETRERTATELCYEISFQNCLSINKYCILCERVLSNRTPTVKEHFMRLLFSTIVCTTCKIICLAQCARVPSVLPRSEEYAVRFVNIIYASRELQFLFFVRFCFCNSYLLSICSFKKKKKGKRCACVVSNENVEAGAEVDAKRTERNLLK